MRRGLETAGAVVVFILMLALSPIIVPLMILGLGVMMKQTGGRW